MPTRRSLTLLALALAVAAVPLAIVVPAQSVADRCVVPASIREPILGEVSGEQAFLHVQLLAANRDRQPEEYQNQYYETTHIRDTARQAGLSDVQVEFFPSSDVWDA